MQFLVSVIDDGQADTAGRVESATDDEMAAVDALNQRLDADGQIVFAAGVSAPGESVVIDNRGGSPSSTEGLVHDGPYVAGFWVLEAPDVEAARAMGAEASAACNRRIEVRALLSA